MWPIPVSYTHLDVYKRQIQRGSAAVTVEGETYSAAEVSYFYHVAYNLSLIHILLHLLAAVGLKLDDADGRHHDEEDHGLGPVSYTHLGGGGRKGPG